MRGASYMTKISHFSDSSATFFSFSLIHPPILEKLNETHYEVIFGRHKRSKEQSFIMGLICFCLCVHGHQLYTQHTRKFCSLRWFLVINPDKCHHAARLIFIYISRNYLGGFLGFLSMNEELWLQEGIKIPRKFI